jgi:geranylgeranyl pyrophosphate synthase
MAINSGNHLYFLPTYLFDNWVGPQNRLLSMMKDFNQVMRRLHFGQGMDIQWHNQHNFLPGVQDYLQMCRFKTGALARLGCPFRGAGRWGRRREGYGPGPDLGDRRGRLPDSG